MGKYKDVPPVIRRVLSMRDEIGYHLTRENRTLEEEFILIIKKESTLPKRLRDYIIHFYDENDKDTETENLNDVPSDGTDELHPGE
jgi:hypothetical protein